MGRLEDGSHRGQDTGLILGMPGLLAKRFDPTHSLDNGHIDILRQKNDTV